MFTFIFIVIYVFIVFIINIILKNSSISNNVFVDKLKNILKIFPLIFIIGIIAINCSALNWADFASFKEIPTDISKDVTNVSSVDTIDTPVANEKFKDAYKYLHIKDFPPLPSVSKRLLLEAVAICKKPRSISKLNKSIDSLDAIINKVSSEYKLDTNSESFFNSDLACVVSEDFIKLDLRYPSTADFSMFDCTADKNDDNSYTVLRKVGAKNAFGVSSEFIYKVKIGFVGGLDADINNWKLLSIRSEEYK